MKNASDTFPGNIVIKGGEIQTVPTSGTTTVTQEMAKVVEQTISTPNVVNQNEKPQEQKTSLLSS